ncbi:glycosyltransferase [Myxococcota bacterium]|nr:glycosyltransferase [Myxococcota bacterium]
MRILQLTSDWKWTGPADPMLGLLLALRERGHDVSLGCPNPPVEGRDSLYERSIQAGVKPVLRLERARGARWWRDRKDARQLGELLRRGDFDVVHTWHTRDHVLARRAIGAWCRGDRVRLVRSYPCAEPIRHWPWNRWLFGRGTDGLICVSPGAALQNRGIRGGAPSVGFFGSVDLRRFSPNEPDPALRRELSLAPHHKVVGIVARVQRHRRFDLLLDAFSELAGRDSDVRLLLLGRGTFMDEIVREPAERLGLSDRLILAGYRTQDYPKFLSLADVLTLLVPGSDGGCRALLEAAACGRPVVTTPRGAMPEIVVHGETGFVVEETPSALAEGWERLLSDQQRRVEMGQAARRRAELHFAPSEVAMQAEALYHEAHARS